MSQPEEQAAGDPNAAVTFSWEDCTATNGAGQINGKLKPKPGQELTKERLPPSRMIHDAHGVNRQCGAWEWSEDGVIINEV